MNPLNRLALPILLAAAVATSLAADLGFKLYRSAAGAAPVEI